jgi:hypothetical protein
MPPQPRGPHSYAVCPGKSVFHPCSLAIKSKRPALLDKHQSPVDPVCPDLTVLCHSTFANIHTQLVSLLLPDFSCSSADMFILSFSLWLGFHFPPKWKCVCESESMSQLASWDNSDYWDGCFLHQQRGVFGV